MKNGKSRTSLNTVLLAVFLTGFLFSLLACGDKNQKPEFKTEYQAIFTTTGHIFFGKIENYTATYILVTNVYLAQNRVDPNTKEVSNFVVNRAKQLHKPDFTYINPASVVMIEPVSADSQIAKMIKEEKEKPPTKN